jgi:two-component system LytT family sensor kinase
MKINRRVGLHLLFWIVYFAVNLFNELYLSPSFTLHPSFQLLSESVQSQLLTLSIKIPATYYVLYSLIPRWLRSSNRLKLALEFAFMFIFLLFCYRGVMHYIIRPFIYKEPAIPLTALQHTARFFYSLLDLLEITAIAAAIKLFGLRLAAMKNEKLLVQEKLQSEMQLLRSQINPHFLFNTLNSIYALSRSRSPDTPDVVMRLSKILRYVLYETKNRLISIEEELRIATDYIELQQIRFGGKVEVVVEKNIDNAAVSVTPLILLPLIENAFKHGVSGISGVARIYLRITLSQDRLTIIVRNPVGTLSLTTSEEEGIGLSNIRRRMELLYNDYRLEYGEKENNFTVELYINLNSYAGFELFDRRR